ncbi:MAG: hydrogenase maturation nickel metallochaperone HypA [Bacteroidales bacterium]
MHELSLAMEVIELAEREAGKNGVTNITEIVIEVGDLSGVEADAFQSALELMVKDTILDHALLTLERTPGMGWCNNCKVEFIMNNRLDNCNLCKCFPSEMTGGKEFRVVSILAE